MWLARQSVPAECQHLRGVRTTGSQPCRDRSARINAASRVSGAGANRPNLLLGVPYAHQSRAWLSLGQCICCSCKCLGHSTDDRPDSRPAETRCRHNTGGLRRWCNRPSLCRAVPSVLNHLRQFLHDSRILQGKCTVWIPQLRLRSSQLSMP